MVCDVIITYCWNRVGYNIMRSLASHGLKVWVADTSKKNICSVSKFCSGSFTYPDPFTEEEKFIECLLSKIEELKPKMLLPTHDESVVIMRNQHLFPKDLLIPYEKDKILETMANKAESSKIAAKVGVPIPQIYSSIEEIRQYPIVFKTVFGNSAKGVYFPTNKEELKSLISNHCPEDYLIEEWVSGTDYSVDCIRWNGFWKSSVYHALVTKTDGGGTTTQREIVELPILEEYAKKILDDIDYNGVCGLDFRYDSETGRAAYIETNARFTGGLATPITARFNIPWILYKLATDGIYNEPINIKIGTKTKWILGDIITLVGRIVSLKWSAKEIKQVFTFSGFDSFDDFFKDDKKAIIGEMCYYLEKLIKNRRLNP